MDIRGVGNVRIAKSGHGGHKTGTKKIRTASEGTQTFTHGVASSEPSATAADGDNSFEVNDEETGVYHIEVIPDLPAPV